MRRMKKCMAAVLAMTMLIMTACSNGKTDSENEGAQSHEEESAGSELKEAIQKVLVDKEDVEISFWTSTGTSNLPYLEAMVNSFQEAYPNIHVDFSSQGAVNDLMDKLTQNIVAKTTPTVSNLNPVYFTEYIQSGAIIDMADYYDDDVIGFTQEEKNSFFETYINEAVSFGGEGTMYGFPTNKKTADILVYNKTYFDQQGWKAPATWDQVAEYSKQIREDTGMPGFSFDCAYGEAAFRLMSRQWGSDYIDDGGNAGIDNDASRAALQFYKDNFDAGYFTMPSEMPSAGGNYSNKGFIVKECYMFIGAHAGMPYAYPKEESGQEVFEVGVAAVPQKDENQKIAFSQGEDYCIFSNASPEERVAGWLLIKFLSRDDQNVDWLTFTGNLPITRTILENEEYKAFLNHESDGSLDYYKAAAVNAVLSMSEYLTTDKQCPITSSLAEECGQMWKSVIVGGQDIEEAIAGVLSKVGR